MKRVELGKGVVVAGLGARQNIGVGGSGRGTPERGWPRADPALQIQEIAQLATAKLQMCERKSWVGSFVSLGDQVEDG